MSHRFYCETPIDLATAVPGQVSLDGTEAHHLLHVMRARVGDRVTLFDGNGHEFDAEVVASGRRDVTLALRAYDAVDREAPVAVTLGVALPKGDRQKVLVEKLTELGVRRLVPLQTEHSVAAPKPAGLEKLRRGVVEASKQCGRNVLMAIDDPTPLDAFLAATEADLRLVAHPSGPPFASARPHGSVAVAIGPEGGFSDTEVASAAAGGWQPVSLGLSILRIETAAIAFAARFRQ